ncbi:isocitrate lyase/phosphoenolpyruvate mutase family protein [Geodermatophilus aquaeductus]|uniref:2-Methylisocitrate lyase, PEP mutase family n=1 Tax=Geodermatophilus aquaeductus TaxID=1564161 RepID=A0A521E1Y9_9ACTN|nr:isocitrate lyase/phosphoenolpyruvate mutase family protein [Geodermatophilus aquaeductus]SMO77974.1 2-Methylisocitrate lyase, PEP mutase family [Geodermatophilus aquaeductus]
MSFADLHRGPRPLLLPNAWDVASALALVADGHPAVGTTSLGVAAAAGIPDTSRAGRAATVGLARALARLPVPVTVDLADGFSDNPAEVAALVAGLPAAGVNLEDSTGGRLVDPERHAAKVAAVAAAAPGVFLNARVDTYWLEEEADLDTTLDRARRYVAAGADGVFVPGPLGEAEVAALVAELPVPLNVLAGTLPLPRLAGLGVRRVSTGSLLFRAALDAAVAVAARLRDGEPAPAATPYAEVDARTATLGA